MTESAEQSERIANRRWDGNVNSPHTMQDEYELARALGANALTTDDDGQMIAAYDHEYEPPLLGAVTIAHTGPLHCRRCGEDHRA